ncbi:hypothetical protein F4823DRAFT_634275 [Ustulina deusta]|nr:hypothetical protein F4823DRAFT_634275 [Ustulina deusta]
MLELKVGAAVMDEDRIVLDSGLEAGSLVRDPGFRSMVMDRPLLLCEILSSLPKEALHANKKLMSLDQATPSGVKPVFGDGEVVECDAVIGADGTFSRVRKCMLGQQVKEYAASIPFSYFTASRLAAFEC